MPDMSALPDTSPETLHGRVGYRDAAMGLALCAYLLYTTSFIVSFHLEQSEGYGYIADNKRVYVIAQCPSL